ncbi:hypothetical protein GCM10017655_02530 [Pseudomonas turukhanskensis]|uniref:Uncharacterized protein n=1 Tax=Pseudomonas turukhanskensis TaxID=1806536 RepID=A0A9W6NE46_9PSED|nr:hypothetical protein GCM10017655_02530 [Pseudomonas turukhanskensis]
MDGPQPGPWSDDAAREPEAQRRAQVGARFFGFFFIDWKKKLARKARNKTFNTRGNAEKQQSPDKPQGARCTPYIKPPCNQSALKPSTPPTKGAPPPFAHPSNHPPQNTNPLKP